MLVPFLIFPLVASFDLFNSLSLDASSDPLVCPSFKCSKPTTSQELMSTCITYANSTNSYELIPCHHGDRLENYCPATTEISSLPATCVAPTTSYPKLYPGEGPCSDNTNCNKGTCTYGVCVGKDVGKTCYSYVDCNSGLRCVSRKCTAQLREGDTGCTKDQDCVNTSGCDFNSTSGVGTCVEYLSKAVGDSIQICDGYVSLLCESAQCATSSTGSYCIKPVTISGTSPQSCKADTDCFGMLDDGTKVYSKCECGYSETGASYCQSFIGDKEGQRYQSELKKWLSSIKIIGCHNEHRFDPLCMKDWNTENFDLFKLRQLTYKNLPKLQGNSDCVKKIYTADYWDATVDYKFDTESDDDMSLSLKCVFVWLVLLLVN
jgi:hypothetical protein